VKQIMVGFDGSDTARKALQWALDEARLHHADVTVVHAWEPAYVDTFPLAATPTLPTERERAAERLLDDAIAYADTTGLPGPVHRSVEQGGPAAALLRVADEVDADLIVVGSRGHGGFVGLLLGSVSRQVVTHAHCPVAVIPAD
jgi:nucleotide-binding universal stress UspA family protein